MVNGHLNSDRAAGDVAAWRSEVTDFIDDAKQELKNIINALQSGSPIEDPKRLNPEPATQYSPDRPAAVAEHTAGENESTERKPADHDDRLEQLKRRIEEQLRSAEQK